MNMLKKCLALVMTSSLAVAGVAHAQNPPSLASMANTEKTTPLTGCPSATIDALFNDFGRTGKMPPELGRWLNDPKEQIIEPYQAFDNVYNVGICWVSAWLIKTSDGPVLIDTLYGVYTDQLIENIKKIGVNPADIKMAL